MSIRQSVSRTANLLVAADCQQFGQWLASASAVPMQIYGPSTDAPALASRFLFKEKGAFDWKTGVGWMVDEKQHLKASVAKVERALVHRVSDEYGERSMYASEEGNFKEESALRKASEEYRTKAKATLTSVTSPKTKKMGWKVTLVPPPVWVEQRVKQILTRG